MKALAAPLANWRSPHCGKKLPSGKGIFGEMIGLDLLVCGVPLPSLTRTNRAP